MSSPKAVQETKLLHERGYLDSAPTITGRQLSAEVAADLNKQGIKTFNLSEEIVRKRGAPETFFWPVDGHFNVAGHLFMGQSLAEYLLYETR